MFPVLVKNVIDNNHPYYYRLVHNRQFFYYSMSEEVGADVNVPGVWDFFLFFSIFFYG